MPETAPQVYDRLWREGLALFQAGRVRTDPHLLAWDADTRRGLTLVIRPDVGVCAQIAALIDAVRAIAPDQYFYHPAELHITVLSLISAVPDFAPDAALLNTWRDALAEVLRGVEPFPLRLRGVVASQDAVIVCGHDDTGALQALRDALRHQLPPSLRGAMERRYPTVTAHSTIVRFQTQPANLPELVRFLTAVHDRDFGCSLVEHLEFTFNDWYMSHKRTTLQARYDLRSG